MEQRKITYVGWLGHGNIGDEALYPSNRKIFSSYRLVPGNRIQHSRITLFGGGTVLPLRALSIMPNRYNYALGVGVDNPRLWGDLDRFLIERIKTFNFRLLSVRGNISRKILESWNIKSEVVGDPCLILRPDSYKRKEESLIGINVTTPRGFSLRDEQRIYRETMKLCKLLKKEGRHLVLIPFWKKDISYIKKISKEANIDILENWTNIQHVLNFIASCNLLIGEKLHSIVFSASACTPFISLAYKPKCLDFVESVGFKEYAVKTNEMTTKRIMKLYRNLLDKWDEMHNLLNRRVEMYRERLIKFATRIKDDIEFLPDDKWSIPSPLEHLKSTVLYGGNMYFYHHINNIWRAWNRLPLRACIERALAI